MKPKTLITAIVVIALVVSSLLALKSCQLDRKLRDMKLKYEAYRALAQAEYELSQEHIGELNAEIVARDKNISKLESSVAEKQALLHAVSAELAELQATEPPTTPDIEELPIVINLRGQVANLTRMFSLATDTINDKDMIIAEWKGKFAAQVTISEEWKNQYDNERALRVQSEEMFKTCERRLKLNKIVSKTALVAVAGAVVYGLVK
jgi:chromosome segregation ATPase